MIIGLSGYARSGKDTVADILIANAGFERIAFADKLRAALYALNPILDIVPERGAIFLQEVIDEFGWDGVKGTVFGPEVRRLLQRMGTEAGRNVLGENIWVDATFKDLDDDKNYVSTDCRFWNEAKSVKAKFGEVWRITRPGVGPINDHISEIGLDKWEFDRHIRNDGTLADLQYNVLIRSAEAKEYYDIARRL